MIAEKKLENLDHSAVRLTITVGKDRAQEEYDSLLKKYSATARIKGFRKGKVPARILEQKFGESLRSEAGMQLVESSLEEAFKEIDKSPLQFEPPKLEGEALLEPEKDFTFSVTYDVFPDVDPGNYEGIEVEKVSASVGAEDINRELERIQDQNAVVVDKPEDAEVATDDIVTISYAELDDSGNTIDGSDRQDFTFTVGTGYNRYKIDDELVGMKKGEEKTIEKSFEDDFEDEELKGRSVRLKVTLTQVKTKEIPELDDELAQDVSDEYETLDDLKKDIRKQLRSAADERIRSKTIEALLKTIVESSNIDLPESMIRIELENAWRSFLERSRLEEEQMLSILAAQEKTKEDMLAEWRSGTEESIKSQLIVNAIMNKENITATDKELEESIAEQAKQSKLDVETTRQRLEEANMIEYLKNRITEKKTFDLLLEKAAVKKGKKIKLLDLLQNNQ